ncbi:hypothetical protein B0T18DRAFT_480423 [Schizothecium vesticola]|uniref:HIT-type domain-containing protein n=1 Tax=Schizothecium vesticola TaxID=314040 RepID=A0AA40K4T2_9PEZI|nr:hypothetical protein B0T18DRAFT_480423 [Schizothecium vesticola]
MNNFGVIEVAGPKTTRAPGWAYVPDSGPTPAQALQPTNRKRVARNQGGLSSSDVSARQDAKIRKDLEALDRDTNKDVNIPIPPKSGSSRASNKHTPNVRKILQSQKTFANHLDDYQALLALAETNPAAAAALNPANVQPPKPSAAPTPARNSPAPPPPASTPAASKRSAAAAKRAAAKEAKEAAEATLQKQPPPPSPSAETPTPAAGPSTATTDVEMTDAPAPEPELPAAAAAEEPQSYPPDGTILPPYRRPPPPSHPCDDDPLLVSHVPPFPTDDELRALMTAPPLSYLEARAARGSDEARYPARVFCEVCGYWGRVRCVKCGARVCALDCLDVHRQECVTRYGL